MEKERMFQMLLIHANYLDEDFQLVQGDIEIQEGRILRVGKDLPRKGGGPGGGLRGELHHCAGLCGCAHPRLRRCGHLRRHPGGPGGHGPLPAATGRHLFLSHHHDHQAGTTIEQALLAAKDMMDHPMEDGARVVGVNMEGPFIAKERKGRPKGGRYPFRRTLSCSGTSMT